MPSASDVVLLATLCVCEREVGDKKSTQQLHTSTGGEKFFKKRNTLLKAKKSPVSKTNVDSLFGPFLALPLHT